MKASKLSKAQITFGLKQAEDAGSGGVLPQGRDQRRDVLQLAEEVCRLIDVRDEAAAHQLGEENSKLQRIVRRPEKHPIRVSMKPAAAHSAYLEPAAARTLSPC